MTGKRTQWYSEHMEGMNEASTGTGVGPDIEEERRGRRRKKYRRRTVAERLTARNPEVHYVMVPGYEIPPCARLRLLLQ